MAYCTTPPKNDRSFTPENRSPWITSLSPVQRTPTSSKKKKINEDIVYMSRKELEKELKAFVTLFSSRKVIKEQEIPSYYEYLKKMIKSLVVDFSQLDHFEDFSDISRSPGHKRAESSGLPIEHLLKLRNFQLERDRLAYEEKLMMHGKYIADLEEQIGKFITEYKTVSGNSFTQGSEVQDLQKRIKALEQVNMELTSNNEQILIKNASLKKDLEILQGKISDLEETIENGKEIGDKETLEIVEKIQKENEILTGKLTEREIAVVQLETEKARLLKEIGGTLDNIRRDNEFEEKVLDEESRRLTFENSYLAQDLKEKDTIIQMLKSEGERLNTELNDAKTVLKEIKSEKENLKKELNESKNTLKEMESHQAQEVKALRQIYEERENNIIESFNLKKSHTKSLSESESSFVAFTSNKKQLPQIIVTQPLLETRINKCASDGFLLEFGSTPLHNLEERARRASKTIDDEFVSLDENNSAYHSLSYYDCLRKQIERYRTNNVLLHKKVENYYSQIEELNDTLKQTNENLDLAQNRCITLQRELENKVNLETLVQTLLTLINKLETKIESLVEENLSLQQANQENILVITKLKNQIEEEGQILPKGLLRQDSSGLEDTAEGSILRLKETTQLEVEFLKKGHEAEIKKAIEAKDKELEEEKIKQKVHLDRYNAHLDVLGKKVQSLVTVNEELGRELEIQKADFTNYKIVVVSILQEASRSVENLKKYDGDIENLLNLLLERNGFDNTEVIRLREINSMMKRDVADAEKLLEERKLLA